MQNTMSSSKTWPSKRTGMYVHEPFDHTLGYNDQPDWRQAAEFSVHWVCSDQLVSHLAKPLFLSPVHVQGPSCVQLDAWPYLVRLQNEMRHFSRGLGRRRAS